MSKRRVEGVCHICGNYGPLSFEHVPPRAAFNNFPVIRGDAGQDFDLGVDAKVRGKIEQRGMGDYTLCHRCNNNTGAWYGEHFVDWCRQGMEILVRSGGSPSLVYLNYAFPLSIIKQVVTMFFSVNSESFHETHQELVRFVLNKDAKYLPPNYRFFVYYNTTGKLRSSGLTGMIKVSSNTTYLISEITFPPFGYVMVIDSDPPDERLLEITHFSRYGYKEFAVATLKLINLPTHTYFPCDYRDLRQIRMDQEKNLSVAREIEERKARS